MSRKPSIHLMPEVFQSQLRKTERNISELSGLSLLHLFLTLKTPENPVAPCEFGLSSVVLVATVVVIFISGWPSLTWWQVHASSLSPILRKRTWSFRVDHVDSVSQASCQRWGYYCALVSTYILHRLPCVNEHLLGCCMPLHVLGSSTEGSTTFYSIWLHPRSFC